jgi:hypothetical protein
MNHGNGTTCLKRLSARLRQLSLICQLNYSWFPPVVPVSWWKAKSSVHKGLLIIPDSLVMLGHEGNNARLGKNSL